MLQHIRRDLVAAGVGEVVVRFAGHLCQIELEAFWLPLPLLLLLLPLPFSPQSGDETFIAERAIAPAQLRNILDGLLTIHYIYYIIYILCII